MTLTAATGAMFGVVENAHVLDYTATEGSAVTVTVRKGDAAAAESDYTYTDTDKTIVFHTAGTYTVTVTAEMNKKSDAESVSITVAAATTQVTVSDLTIAAKGDALYGHVGQTHTLQYTVTPSTETGTVVVEKQEGENWTAVEGAYSVETGELVFDAVGLYRVTVSAAGGRAVSKIIGITGIEATVTAALTTEGAYGKITSEYLLTTDITLCTGDKINDTTVVKFTKTVDGVSADAQENVDYTYTSGTGAVQFGRPGKYTIEVSCSRADVDATSKTIAIEIQPVYDPIISLEVGNGDDQSRAVVEEGTAVSVRSSVVYSEPDVKKSEDFVVYAQTQDGCIEADDTLYEWVGEGHDSFRPLVAGMYQIKLAAAGALDTQAEKVVVVEATVAPIVLELTAEKTNGYVRVANAGGDITYTVRRASGVGDPYFGGYTIGYSAGDAGVTASAAQGGVHVTATDSCSASVIVTFTHKTYSYIQVTLEIPVGFVTDLENSPVLGEDPFGGTYGRLIPSTGLMLYYDAKVGDTQIGYENVEYTVEDVNLFKSDGSQHSDVVINKLYDMVDYPFILVRNFENNTATGTVTVKMTAKSGVNTAVATKVFTVRPLDKDAPSDKDHVNVEGLNEYIANIYGREDTNFDKIMSSSNRQNMMISKKGIVINSGQWGTGNIAVVEPNGVDNFQLDFKYTVLKRLGADNKASFAVNFRTGKWEGYCGSQTAFYAEKQSENIVAGYWGDNTSKTEGTHPPATIGSTIHVRFTHTVDGNVVHFVWKWSADGENYNDWLQFDVNKSTSQGNIGAPVYAMQFNHEDGSYCLGGMKLTVL